MYFKNARFHTAEDLFSIEAGKKDFNQNDSIYESDTESETSEESVKPYNNIDDINPVEDKSDDEDTDAGTDEDTNGEESDSDSESDDDEDPYKDISRKQDKGEWMTVTKSGRHSFEPRRIQYEEGCRISLHKD